MKKKFLLTLSPCLLLFLLPFHVPLSVFYHTLAPYGTINKYLVASVIFLTSVLLFDVFLSNEMYRKRYTGRLSWLLLLLASLALRFGLFDFQTDDYREALSVWFDYIKDNGGFAALKYRNFSDYNSLYLYLMAGLTYLPIHKLYSIKLLTVLFDFLGAWALFKIVALKNPTGFRPFFAALVLLLAPTVLFNGALWAQCDMIFTAFLLWSLYYMIKDLPNFRLAIVFFAFGLMFKLQAVFFVLPLTFIYLSRKVKLWEFLIIPLVWVITILPNVLLGRSFFDLLLIYARQVVRYPSLAYNSPSLYNLFPNAPFELFNTWGIILAFCFVMLFVGVVLKLDIKFNKEVLIRIAFISVMVIPFFLPKMHERYFFAADIFAIVYVFFVGRLWFVAIAMNLISLSCYVPFLFKEELFEGKYLTISLLAVICIVLYEFWDFSRMNSTKQERLL
ncbi:hypothetical protein R9C00_23565 [Flammeovirgaceae bacterium SG7u.111]|nr:hypothetical protein [Flammeovirgaceae bacterium SG7u.132]WPO34684.1 hypothetical protein R9C00_23565 [Flammeovirgaceae bacterium SG7u.111]